VCGSVQYGERQYLCAVVWHLRQCATVWHGVRHQCERHCVAVRAAVCGSAATVCNSVCVSVRQCAAVQQCASVRGSVDISV
jgi:hypothetical protein